MSAETMTTVVGVKATFSVGGSNAIHHFDSSEERMDPHPSKGNEKEVKLDMLAARLKPWSPFPRCIALTTD